MKKEMICINCPRGCHLTVDTETLEVTGNLCPRGKTYGVSEITNPTRTITSTCKVDGGFLPRVSCKTSQPVPKKMIFEVMKEINKVEVKAPVEIGQVLIENVLNTGSNIIATKAIKKI
jgi:CxxC motif-containing protein